MSALSRPLCCSHPMLIPFALPEWVAAFRDVINASAAYREAVKNWEGNFWFIVEARGPASSAS
jgi:hypothetical protein